MTHARIAAFLLGAWLLGSVFLAFAATRNFKTVDAVLSTPPSEASKMIQTLGHDDARQLLRYLAGEQNRGYFETWEIAQLVIGAALVCFLILGMEKRLPAALAGAMLAFTLFEYFKLTPDLTELGRSVAFISQAAESESRSQFLRLHGIYAGIEVVKMLLAVMIAGFLFLTPQNLRRRIEIDPVDHPNHRHIDR